MSRNVSYRKAVYANCGLKTEQFLYTASDKGGHKEKEVTPYRMNLAMDSFILFTEAGYKIASRMTIGMMLVAFFCAVYTVGDLSDRQCDGGLDNNHAFFVVCIFRPFCDSDLCYEIFIRDCQIDFLQT